MFDPQPSQLAIRRQSPLAAYGLDRGIGDDPARAGVVVTEEAFLGHLNLRGNPGDPAFLAAAAETLGLRLPLAANTFAEGGGHTAYWLGPDEWLIVMPGKWEQVVASELRQALDGLFAAVTVLGGGQTVINLRGPAAAKLLRKDCPLDLHPSQFGAGQCAQTHIAKAPVLIRRIDPLPSYQIVIRRSFADYFWLWLTAASRDLGLAGSQQV